MFNIPYKTRWTNTYKKEIITKMYSVEEYLTKKSNTSIITLLTLTGYQNGPTSIAHTGNAITREQLFKNIKWGWRHISNIIQKELPNIEYFWVVEPHKSGYPHMHIALFGHIPKKTRNRLKNLWTEKYNIGSTNHGINFKVKTVNQSISSIKNYLLKYIAKSIGTHGRKNWSPEEFLYHAIAWKNHHRYIGMSRSISRYCTAHKLRYRFIQHIAFLCNKFIPMPELPTTKNELIHAINYYRKLPGVDPPNPEKLKWHYTFTLYEGTLSLIHQKKTQSRDTINRINTELARILKYTDQFIQYPQNT
jgi:hypothetical protein